MVDLQGLGACCDGCASTPAAVRIARRRLLKAAVFGPAAVPAGAGPGDDHGLGFAMPGELPRAVMGKVIDVSPQVLVISQGSTELRLALTADVSAWRGGPADPEGLHIDDVAVIRLDPARRGVADRIWCNIGRVTGTIIECQDNTLLVDPGTGRERQVVVVPSRAASRIQVRYPNLRPGYLMDVIGLRWPGHLEAIVPATPQPVYPVTRLPEPPLVSGHVPGTISGSATWREPAGEPYGLLGVGYPALDPDAGCAAEPPGQAAAGFVRMPYLSVGSLLRIRNQCSGAQCVLPVTSCAPIARLFNDRCLTCATSPRGRIAELTLASFVALGGELERGCFNATITVGER
ncbi:MAG TPA: hypothetical protein VH637_13880 [Streptosporangiaceae bacterium]